MIRAEIISVGDEIVCGQIADSNAAWLSQRLAELGIPVQAHAAARDAQAEVETAVTEAAARSDVVIVTGGLGPTHDDVTREAVAACAGTGLVTEPAELEHLRSLFASRGMQMPASNEKQATIPRGADVLHNPTGTAAGFHVQVGGASVFVLPGVPSEMEAMFAQEVVPLLPQGQGMIAMRALRCLGMSESLIAQKLEAEINLNGDPKVAFLASGGIITVKFTSRAATRELALEQVAPACERAREVLGNVVFGEDDDTVADSVARLLESLGATIAVAESCTGGLVANWLTDVPGISRFFLEGLVTYSNESKIRLLGVPAELFGTVGAVSEKVARRMAEGARARAGAAVGLGVTGIAGPSGGSPGKPVGTVHVVVATPERTTHRKLELRGDRARIKDRAAKYALNAVRLELVGH